MFRIVNSATTIGPGPASDNHPHHPYFWLVCDNRACGISARADIPTPDQLDPGVDPATLTTEWMKQFVERAGQEGWMVGLDAQFCPAHAKAMIEQAAAREREASSRQAANGQPQPLVQLAKGVTDMRKAEAAVEAKRRVDALVRKAN